MLVSMLTYEPTTATFSRIYTKSFFAFLGLTIILSTFSFSANLITDNSDSLQQYKHCTYSIIISNDSSLDNLSEEDVLPDETLIECGQSFSFNLDQKPFFIKNFRLLFNYLSSCEIPPEI